MSEHKKNMDDFIASLNQALTGCGCFVFADLTMGTAPQVAPPSWGAPMVNVVCVLKHGV